MNDTTTTNTELLQPSIHNINIHRADKVHISRSNVTNCVQVAIKQHPTRKGNDDGGYIEFWFYAGTGNGAGVPVDVGEGVTDDIGRHVYVPGSGMTLTQFGITDIKIKRFGIDASCKGVELVITRPDGSYDITIFDSDSIGLPNPQITIDKGVVAEDVYAHMERLDREQPLT